MEDYVTFEQAQRLKELGFDWACNHYYHIEDEERIAFLSSYDNHNNRSKKAVSAMTLAQAQKWLREEKGIVILIDYERYDEKESFYCYDIRYTDDNRITVGLEFSTYEQALSAGIDRALELLK